MIRKGFIYLLTNKSNSTLYVGVTSDLQRRIYEHKQKLIKGFSQKYNLTKVVYFEGFDAIGNAIEREKQVKSWSRKRKNRLIEVNNFNWEDLYSEIL